jgi:hypothetical protein
MAITTRRARSHDWVKCMLKKIFIILQIRLIHQ